MERSNITLGKRKEVDTLMNHCVFGETFRWGPYTFVAADHTMTGIRGFGLARKGSVDSDNGKIGERIARYRAVRSIYCKITKKGPHHPLMG